MLVVPEIISLYIIGDEILLQNTKMLELGCHFENLQFMI